MVCAKCSGQKFPLAYEDNKLCRVCRGCFHQLILNQKQQLPPDFSEVAAEGKQALVNGNAINGHHNDNHAGGEEEDEEEDGDSESARDVLGRPRGLLEVRTSRNVAFQRHLQQQISENIRSTCRVKVFFFKAYAD